MWPATSAMHWRGRRSFPLEKLRRRLRDRLRDGRVPPHLEQPIREFERDGYYVLEGAALAFDLDRFEEAIAKAFREGHEHLIAQDPSIGKPKPVSAGMS